MAKQHVVEIDAAGRLRFVYDDELAGLLQEGEAEVRRASHVEPCGEGWQADLAPSGGPVLSGFALRGDALEAERAWLDGQLRGGTLPP